MRSSVKTLLASAAILALPGAVLAQDWAGPYGGLTVGYAFGDANHSYSNGAPSDNSTPEGSLIGLFAGYAWQSGNLVYGAEIDFEAADVDGAFVNTTGATSQGVVNQDWQASIRGVLGYAGQMSGNPALYYATAGWATGDFEFLGGPSFPVPPGGGYSEQLSGWTAGLGMDMMMSANAALRVEYRYTDFGEASDNLSPTFPGVTMPVEVTQHALRVGVRMNF